jgi:sporulation protein YlmC with PRC-barrel domain
MNLRSRLLGSLWVLMALLSTGCAEEEMLPPTPIARFTPAVAGVVAEPDPADEAAEVDSPTTTGEQATAEPTPVQAAPVLTQTPSASAVELRPAEPGAIQLDEVAEAEIAEPIIIALATVKPGASQPQVIPLDVATLDDPQPNASALEVGDLSVIMVEPGGLALTELEIIQPDVDPSAVIGVEAGADPVVLSFPSETTVITGTVMEASSLLSYPVVNVDGRDLGRFDDLVVNLADGQFLLATLTYGGLLNLNLGSQVLPIPPTFLSWDAGGEHLRLGLSTAELNEMEGFGNRWPELDRAEWGLEALSSWRGVDRTLITETPITHARTTPETVWLVSSLQGESVGDSAGEELARVDDLLIELESGAITHLILRQGGFLGLGDNQYAVPFAAFEFVLLDDTQRQAAVILDATREDFANAPVYSREGINFDDPEWSSPFRDYWLQTSDSPATTP